MKVLSYGEILWDIIEENYYLGGAPFNFAAHLAQCGASTYMISRLGKDQLGEKAYESAKKLSVATDFIQWDEVYPTGTVDVRLKNGQPSYTINPEVAYDFIDYEKLEEDGLFLQEFDVFAFGTLIQRHQTSRNSLRRVLKKMSFDHLFYDVNLRKDCYSPEVIKESLTFCNILKLNDEEVTIISEILYGEALDEETFCRHMANDFYQDIVIVTAGGEGCLVFHRNKLHQVSGKKVTVVDTVGAGDSFSAAFLYKFLKVGDPVEAAAAANQVGAFVASSRGPIPMYTPEIKKILGIV